PNDVGIGHEHVGSGCTATPGAFMSTAIIVTPACLGASGSVRTVAQAPLAHVRQAGPHLLPGDPPATVDLSPGPAARVRPSARAGRHCRPVRSPASPSR